MFRKQKAAQQESSQPTDDKNTFIKPKFDNDDSYVEEDEFDYLDDDKIPSGFENQKYTVLSIYNPVDMIKKRERNLFEHYLHNLMESFEDNKMVVDHDDEGEASVEKSTKTNESFRNRFHFLMEHLEWKRIKDSFEDFKLYKKTAKSLPNQVEIDNQFVEDNDDATAFLTVKNRGTASSDTALRRRMRTIREFDQSSALYTAKSFCWMAWNPDQVRMSQDPVSVLRELNTLMRLYYEMLDQRDCEFEEHKNKSLAKAREERHRVYLEQGKTEDEIELLEKEHQDKISEMRDITTMKNKKYDEIMEQNREMMKQVAQGNDDVNDAIEAEKKGVLTTASIRELEEDEELEEPEQMESTVVDAEKVTDDLKGFF